MVKRLQSMAKVALTAGRIANFSCPPERTQAFLWDLNTKGLGVRTTPRGAPMFVFQSQLLGKTVRLKIGSPKAWSISQAQAKARELQREIDQGYDPRQLIDQRTKKLAAEKAQRELIQKFTFESLLGDYCDHIKKLGRRSHTDARSIFKLHVIEKWGAVAAKPANQITGEEIADMMRALISSGKGRTSNKLRSYIRAAYQTAKAAKTKASIPVHFKGYEITHNPASDTEPDDSFNKPDKNPLSIDELRMYWRLIRVIPEFKGAVLRLHVLTGGQRIEQLVKLVKTDISHDRITLFDSKGKPAKGARPNTVPLIEAAVACLEECNHEANILGDFAISTQLGKTHLSASTLSRWAKEVAAKHIKDFDAKRIRSGIETLLASVQVSSEIRGRLQSHGVTGVQARHYDGHDYQSEKRLALEELYSQLNSTSSKNVVALKIAA